MKFISFLVSLMLAATLTAAPAQPAQAASEVKCTDLNFNTMKFTHEAIAGNDMYRVRTRVFWKYCIDDDRSWIRLVRARLSYTYIGFGPFFTAFKPKYTASLYFWAANGVNHHPKDMVLKVNGTNDFIVKSLTNVPRLYIAPQYDAPAIYPWWKTNLDAEVAKYPDKWWTKTIQFKYGW